MNTKSLLVCVHCKSILTCTLYIVVLVKIKCWLHKNVMVILIGFTLPRFFYACPKPVPIFPFHSNLWVWGLRFDRRVVSTCSSTHTCTCTTCILLCLVRITCIVDHYCLTWSCDLEFIYLHNYTSTRATELKLRYMYICVMIHIWLYTFSA